MSATPGPSFADAKAVFQVSDAMYDLRVTQDRIAKEAKSMERQLLDAFEAGWNAHIDATFDAGRDPDQLAAENARLRAEMQRYLPLLERAEDYPVIWRVLTEGTGIATVNGYRAALSPAPAKKENERG